LQRQHYWADFEIFICYFILPVREDRQDYIQT
jgi:hypothetical protein